MLQRGRGVGGYPCVWRGLTTLTEEPRRGPFLTHRTKIADGAMAGEIRGMWMVSSVKREFPRWEKFTPLPLSLWISLSLYFKICLLLFLSFSDCSRRKKEYRKEILTGERGGRGEEPTLQHKQNTTFIDLVGKTGFTVTSNTTTVTVCTSLTYTHTHTFNTHKHTSTHTTQYYI